MLTSPPTTEPSSTATVSRTSSSGQAHLVRLLPAALVALAAVLRLLRLNMAEYRGDDDDMVTAATQALQHGWLQAHGLISSIPIDNGPVAMWLLMLPLAITSSLLVAQVWVALLNIGAVALCYHAVRTIWNRPLALVATALYAVSPWAVMYSRRLWITAFDAPLALLAFWLLLRWLRAAAPWQTRPAANGATLESAESPMAVTNVIAFPTSRMAASRGGAWRRYGPPLLAGLAFSAFFQAHVVPMGDLLTLLLILLLLFRTLGGRRILLCLATLVATMAPYILTTVIPAIGRSVAGQQARHPSVNALSWFDFGNLVTGRGYQSIAPQGSRLLDATSLPLTIVDWLAVGLLVAGVLATLVTTIQAFRAKDRYVAGRGVILLLWALIPPLGLMVHLVEVHPYYFVVSMPAIYILEAAGVLALARLAHRLSHRMAPGAVASGVTGLLMAAQLALAVPFFLVIPEFWNGADYGVPLQDTEHLATMARALAGGTLAVVGGYDHDVDYTLYSTLGRVFPGARYADDRGILEYAATGPALLYLTTDDQAWETRTLLADVASSQVAQLQLPGQGKTFRFFRPSLQAIQGLVRQLAPPLKQPRQFGAVVQITGAAVRGNIPGSMAHVSLDWRLLQEPAQPMLMKLELTGGDNYIWTSTEAVSYPAGYWHPGDAARVAFLDNIDVPLPAYLPPGQYGVVVRLVGIADGHQIGAPETVGSLKVSPSVLAMEAAAKPAAVPTLPHATNIAVAPGLTLAGWQLDRTRVQQNDVLGAVLFWRVTGPVTQVPPLQLRHQDGTTPATTDTSELATSVPASRWPAGALIADRHLLRVDGRADPGAATAILITQSGQAVTLGQVTVVALARTAALPSLPHATDVTFGAVIRLAGYGLTPVAARAGSPLRVTLVWQGVGLPSADETVFVHLLNASGTLVAQADGPPGGTAEPTSTWEPGQVVTDVHTLALPATSAPGAYHIQIGLYNLQTGTRLPAAGAGLAGGADHIDLPSITVTKP